MAFIASERIKPLVDFRSNPKRCASLWRQQNCRSGHGVSGEKSFDPVNATRRHFTCWNIGLVFEPFTRIDHDRRSHGGEMAVLRPEEKSLTSRILHGDFKVLLRREVQEKHTPRDIGQREDDPDLSAPDETEFAGLGPQAGSQRYSHRRYGPRASLFRWSTGSQCCEKSDGKPRAPHGAAI